MKSEQQSQKTKACFCLTLNGEQEIDVLKKKFKGVFKIIFNFFVLKKERVGVKEKKSGGNKQNCFFFSNV